MITRLWLNVLFHYVVSQQSAGMAYHAQGLTLAQLHSAPLDPLTPLDVLLSSPTTSGSASTSTSASDSTSDSDSESESVSRASAARSFAVFKSMLLCYHQHRDTLAPALYVVRSQRFRIGRVAMYCATVFCRLVMDSRISINSAFRMPPCREG